MARKQESQSYIPGFDGVRFIAASAVVVHHIEQSKDILGFKSLWLSPVIKSLGHQGVNLFFVLSGFLITYILLIEHSELRRISIKKFYLRRILRIWPLYYMIMLIAFVLVPIVAQFSGDYGLVWSKLRLDGLSVNENYIVKFLCYFTLFPNLAYVLYPGILFAAQSWSIGVEEQFYLVWPLLFRIFNRYLVHILVLVIFAKYIFGIIINQYMVGNDNVIWNDAVSS
ncbi:MAG: acyltransferase, partial [Candidatus Poribacteria bacterium]